MSDQLFEHAVRDWLEDGSDRTPAPAIDAVLLAIKTTPQERDLRIPRRFNPMTTYMRLAAAIAIVAVLGVGILLSLRPGPDTGGRSTPSPVPTASPAPTTGPSVTLGPIDTALWTTYSSDRYGFTIKHPDDWAEEVSDHAWTWETDFEAWTSTGTDSFFTSAGEGVKFSAWSVAIAPGSTAEDGIDTWCTAHDAGPCATMVADAVPVETGDGLSGLGLFGTEDTMAFFVDGEVLYVAAIWRPETDPSVQPFGGARRLLEAFLSTFSRTEPSQASPVAS